MVSTHESVHSYERLLYWCERETAASGEFNLNFQYCEGCQRQNIRVRLIIIFSELISLLMR